MTSPQTLQVQTEAGSGASRSDRYNGRYGLITQPGT